MNEKVDRFLNVLERHPLSTMAILMLISSTIAILVVAGLIDLLIGIYYYLR